MDVQLIERESRVIDDARCAYLWGEILFNFFHFISSNSVWILRASRENRSSVTTSTERNDMFLTLFDLYWICCDVTAFRAPKMETINSSSSVRAWCREVDSPDKRQHSAHIITSIEINLSDLFRLFVLLFIFTVIFPFCVGFAIEYMGIWFVVGQLSIFRLCFVLFVLNEKKTHAQIIDYHLINRKKALVRYACSDVSR